MIVVDSSVWIDFLRGNESAAADEFGKLLRRGDALATTEVIYTEILQGVRDDAQAAQVETHLRAYPALRSDDLTCWSLAAKLYRTARRRGITIRNTTDCMIAAPCIQFGAALLHKDADFDRLATVSELKIWRY